MENHIKAIECLRNLYELIQQEETGTPDELAARLNISRSMLNRILEKAKEMGVPVQYDRTRRTYYYKGVFDISSAPFWILKFYKE